MVKLHTRGQVVGTCDQPLELYVVLDRSTIAYRTIERSVAGQPFDMVYEETATDWCRRSTDRSNGPELRIDLVNGAVVWYTVLTHLPSVG